MRGAGAEMFGNLVVIDADPSAGMGRLDVRTSSARRVYQQQGDLQIVYHRNMLVVQELRP